MTFGDVLGPIDKNAHREEPQSPEDSSDLNALLMHLDQHGCDAVELLFGETTEAGRSAQHKEDAHVIELVEQGDRRAEQNEQNHELRECAADRLKQLGEQKNHGDVHELANKCAHDAEAKERCVGDDVQCGRGGIALNEQCVGHVEDAEHAERDEREVEKAGDARRGHGMALAERGADGGHVVAPGSGELFLAYPYLLAMRIFSSDCRKAFILHAFMHGRRTHKGGRLRFSIDRQILCFGRRTANDDDPSCRRGDEILNCAACKRNSMSSSK